MGRLVAASHTRAVPSRDAATTRLLSTLFFMPRTPSSWRNGWPIGTPVAASHNRTVLSKDPVTTRVPSGLNDALRTPASCRMRVFRLLIGLRIPNARGKVVGRGYHPRPVRTKRRTVESISVQHGLVDRQPARRIPRPRCC